jgi:hypothetical protein
MKNLLVLFACLFALAASAQRGKKKYESAPQPPTTVVATVEESTAVAGTFIDFHPVVTPIYGGLWGAATSGGLKVDFDDIPGQIGYGIYIKYQNLTDTAYAYPGSVKFGSDWYQPISPICYSASGSCPSIAYSYLPLFYYPVGTVWTFILAAHTPAGKVYSIPFSFTQTKTWNSVTGTWQ